MQDIVVGRMIAWTICASIVVIDVVAARKREAFITQPPPPVVASFFTCAGRPMGYYADVGTNCRAYHTCDDHGNRFTHYCPRDTAFRQDAMICDHAYLVDCQANAKKVTAVNGFQRDDNRDAPSGSYDVTRNGDDGGGNEARGFVRSFRINPTTSNENNNNNNNNNGTMTTFVLNSSVFLTNRDTTTTSKRPDTTRYQEPRTIHHRVDVPIPVGFSRSTPVVNSPTTTTTTTSPRPSIANELQPPYETSNYFNRYEEDNEDTRVEQPQRQQELSDEYSFLIPPPIRDDNNYYAQQQQRSNDFESLRNNDNNKQRSSTFRIVTLDTTTTQRNNPVVPKSRTLFNDNNNNNNNNNNPNKPEQPPKPVNYLEPPFTDEKSRVSLNRATNDPYADTLLSLHNLSKSSSSQATTTTQITTTASLLPIPSRTLTPGTNNDADPYYPRSSTTEAYYTPRTYGQAIDTASSFTASTTTTTTKRGLFNAQAKKFEIPAVLPDLNSLEDLLDRRKFFFIPRTKSV